MRNAASLERATSISSRQLRLFESVGRVRSIRRTAEECNLSQPAVTQAIAKLEAQVGATLLKRGASGSDLNELGAILHRRLCRFFEQVELAIVELGVPEAGLPAAVVARRLTRSQIRSLLVAVDGHAGTDAARSHGLSPASLQRASLELERNLGRQLYCRTASGNIVTPEGISFGRKIKLAVHEIEWGLREIEAAQGQQQSRIVIGAMPCGSSVLLASVLDEFVKNYPHASISVVNESASSIIASLLSGDLDIVIGLVPETLDPELSAETLARTHYEIAVRRGHRLLGRGPVTRDDLAGYDWVVGQPTSSRRDAFDQLFADHPGPRAPIVTCSMSIIRHLLVASDRLTLMTSYELNHEGRSLVSIPYATPGTAPTIGMLTRRSWLPTDLHRAFEDLLRRRVAGVHVPSVVARTG